ncbi:N-acetyltransferase family protein [Virgibacillus oceani]
MRGVLKMIRQAHMEDARGLAALIRQVESESPFMLYEAGERELTEEAQRKMMERFSRQKNATIFVAEENETLAGYLIAIGGTARKNKHSAYIVVGILQEHQGKGIGTALFQELENWAMQSGLHRLELTVITENLAGTALYEKAGFQKEGVKKDSLYMDGKYVDEYCMSKILEG